MASTINAPSESTSITATVSDATIIARSRRKGWLARLIGILISIVPGDGPQVPEQPGVVFARRAKRRTQRLDLHREFLPEAPLSLAGLRSEPAEEQALGAPAEVVLDIDERRDQDGGNVAEIGRG